MLSGPYWEGWERAGDAAKHLKQTLGSSLLSSLLWNAGAARAGLKKSKQGQVCQAAEDNIGMENGDVRVKTCCYFSSALRTARGCSSARQEQRNLTAALIKNSPQRNHRHPNHTAILRPNQHSEHVQNLSQDSPGKYNPSS